MGDPCLPQGVRTAAGGTRHALPTSRSLQSLLLRRRSAARRRRPARLAVPLGRWAGKAKPRAPGPAAREGWPAGFSVLGPALPQKSQAPLEEPPRSLPGTPAGRWAEARLGLGSQSRGTADRPGAACAPRPGLGNAPAGEQGQVPGRSGEQSRL